MKLSTLAENDSTHNHMWVVIGTVEEVHQTKIGGKFKTDYRDEEVALFTDSKKAQNWINKHRLATPKRQTYAGTKTFKSRSPLSFYSSARVEAYDSPELPIDPD